MDQIFYLDDLDQMIYPSSQYRFRKLLFRRHTHIQSNSKWISAFHVMRCINLLSTEIIWDLYQDSLIMVLICISVWSFVLLLLSYHVMSPTCHYNILLLDWKLNDTSFHIYIYKLLLGNRSVSTYTFNFVSYFQNFPNTVIFSFSSILLWSSSLI